MIRITADIDKKNIIFPLYYAFKAWRNIKRIHLLEIKRSQSGNFHMIVWTSYPYRVWEVFRLRRIIGDDKHRLSMDRMRKFGRNTLFFKKETFKYRLHHPIKGKR